MESHDTVQYLFRLQNVLSASIRSFCTRFVSVLLSFNDNAQHDTLHENGLERCSFSLTSSVCEKALPEYSS